MPCPHAGEPRGLARRAIEMIAVINAGTTAGKPIVLLVDDKPANLLALGALLGEEYQLLFASSGDEAVSMVGKQAHVDVILMDVQMPGMDGFQAAAAIKKMDAGKEVPIIFLTPVFHDDPHVTHAD